jgi:hypothetical protein
VHDFEKRKVKKIKKPLRGCEEASNHLSSGFNLNTDLMRRHTFQPGFSFFPERLTGIGRIVDIRRSPYGPEL